MNSTYHKFVLDHNGVFSPKTIISFIFTFISKRFDSSRRVDTGLSDNKVSDNIEVTEGNVNFGFIYSTTILCYIELFSSPSNFKAE